MRNRRVFLPVLLSLLATFSAGYPALGAKPQDVIVYVTNTGSKYHVDGCRYLRESRIPMKLSEARKRFDPCSVCRPPR